MMPGDRNAQYRRNFLRAPASVATARVSVVKIEPPEGSGVDPECPRDLHAVGLGECRELVGRQRAEHRVGLPRLGHPAHDNFAARTLGEHAPADELIAAMRPFGRLVASGLPRK